MLLVTLLYLKCQILTKITSESAYWNCCHFLKAIATTGITANILLLTGCQPRKTAQSKSPTELALEKSQNDAKMEAETKRKEEAFENRRRERQEQRKRVLEEKEKQKEATKRAAHDENSEETAQKARAEL